MTQAGEQITLSHTSEKHVVDVAFYPVCLQKVRKTVIITDISCQVNKKGKQKRWLYEKAVGMCYCNWMKYWRMV